MRLLPGEVTCLPACVDDDAAEAAKVQVKYSLTGSNPHCVPSAQVDYLEQHGVRLSGTAALCPSGQCRQTCRQLQLKDVPPTSVFLDKGLERYRAKRQ